jgi:ParB family chromosome partitioning protein
MKLPISLVAVKKISSSMARSSFSAEEIEKVAHLIVSVEGTINPIILKRTSLESYEVVDGHFEYYAAVRAREISPLKGEMIQAIILEPENEKILLEQVALLRKEINPDPSSNGSGADLEFRFANLEKIFQSQFEELRKENRELQASIDVLTKVQNSQSGSELVDQIVGRVTEAVRQENERSKPKRRRNKSIEDIKPLDLNTASQDELETIPGIGAKKALDIIERRENKKFTNIDELAEIKGISKKVIDKNRWRECFIECFIVDQYNAD